MNIFQAFFELDFVEQEKINCKYEDHDDSICNHRALPVAFQEDSSPEVCIDMLAYYSIPGMHNGL